MYCNKCGNDIGQANVCPVCGNVVAEGGYNNPFQAQVENFNLITAYKSMFKKYAKFDGRSRRSEYWWASLMNYIIVMVAYMIMFIPMMAAGISGNVSGGTAAIMIIMGVVLVLYAFAIIVPSIALTVRRLHDTGRSGWFVLLSLIPYIGGIILFVFTVLDSTPGPNQYGPNPKGM